MFGSSLGSGPLRVEASRLPYSRSKITLHLVSDWKVDSKPLSPRVGPLYPAAGRVDSQRSYEFHLVQSCGRNV